MTLTGVQTYYKIFHLKKFFRKIFWPISEKKGPQKIAPLLLLLLLLLLHLVLTDKLLRSPLSRKLLYCLDRSTDCWDAFEQTKTIYSQKNMSPMTSFLSREQDNRTEKSLWSVLPMWLNEENDSGDEGLGFQNPVKELCWLVTHLQNASSVICWPPPVHERLSLWRCLQRTPSPRKATVSILNIDAERKIESNAKKKKKKKKHPSMCSPTLRKC